MNTCLGKSCSFWFTIHVFRECLTISVCVSFPFGFEGGMWDSILLVPDYCLSFYFSLTSNCLSLWNVEFPSSPNKQRERGSIRKKVLISIKMN